MRPLRVHTGVLLGLLFVLACSGGDGGSGDTFPTDPVASPQPLRCSALAQRACPCTHGGMGVQQCLADGASYGPCEGCPPAPVMEPVDALDASAAADASSAADAGGAGDMDGSTASADASMDPSTADAGDGGELTQLPAGEGTSCGVGLPSLCTLGSEYCCVRSLMTDTCMGESESCTCPLQGCSTLEARCDGPEDCSDGQVCCGTLAGSSYSTFSCAQSCDFRGSQRIACHQGDATTECPAGQVCANSQLLTNLQVCIDPSSIAQ